MLRFEFWVADVLPSTLATVQVSFDAVFVVNILLYCEAYCWLHPHPLALGLNVISVLCNQSLCVSLLLDPFEVLLLLLLLMVEGSSASFAAADVEPVPVSEFAVGEGDGVGSAAVATCVGVGGAGTVLVELCGRYRLTEILLPLGMIRVT